MMARVFRSIFTFPLILVTLRIHPLELSVGKPRTHPYLEGQLISCRPCRVVYPGTRFHYRPTMAIMTPAAIAEPITPATFGPMACMSR